MPTQHKCVQSDRILSLEINFTNFMRTINEKLDNLLVVLNKIPDTYATKVELNMVVSELNNQTTIKGERIKGRGALVVAIVSAIGVVVSTIIR